MSGEESRPFKPFGGFENLKGYQVAEVIYAATGPFCERFYPDDRRMTDQMVQAARSGVRNLSEGSGASGTSRKSEMLLTNVAHSSLKNELLPDYRHFLVSRGLRIWDKDEPRTLELRRRLQYRRVPDLPAPAQGVEPFTGLDCLPRFVTRADPEVVGNVMICAIHQATYLIMRQLNRQRSDFEREGGFSEELYRSRRRRRG